MSENVELNSDERKIADTIEDLPPLKEGYMRLVHITNSPRIQNILDTGLDYEKYAMVMSTAVGYSSAEQAEYSSEDPRFASPQAKAIVMDLPADEHKLHNNVTKSPGRIPAKYIVGVVPANQNKK